MRVFFMPDILSLTGSIINDIFKTAVDQLSAWLTLFNTCLVVNCCWMVSYSVIAVSKRKQAMTPMQTINNMFKWSLMVSGMTGLLLVGGIFSTWLLIEMLAVLVGISA